MKTKKNISLFLITMLAFFIATTFIHGGNEIVIGVAGAHSGDLASYGLPSVKAAQLVIDDVNKKGGIDGKKVRLEIADDVCKPEVATNTATKLIGKNVVAVVGHICSGATKAALGIYKQKNIVCISPSATTPTLTKSGAYPNFFRTIAPDDAQAEVMVNFATKKLKVKRVAIIHDKGDYGKGFAEFCQKYLKGKRGVKVVMFEGVTPGGVDYSAVINKVRLKRADAVIFGGYHPEASKIVTQMRKKKMKTPFLSDDGVKDDTFIKVARSYAEGVYATGPKDTSSNPLAKKAIADHKRKYGKEPGAFFLNAYAATLAIVNAIDKANSTDYRKVTKALRSNYVNTPIGRIKFDSRGDAIGAGFSVYQVKRGKYVEL